MNSMFTTLTTRAVAFAFAAALVAAMPAQAADTTWKVDPVHSSASFTAVHLLISHVTGTIPIKNASVTVPNGSNIPTAVQATLDPSGIDTRVADRDADLKSPHFFDVATYPTMTFQSTKITATDDKHFTIQGNLTMHGVTHSVTLNGQYLGRGPGFRTETRIAYVADGSVDRTQWGMTYGTPAVSANIDMHLEIEAANQ